MAKDEGYNGWRNYATWRVNLELVDEYVELDLTRDSGVTFVDLPAFADHLAEYVDEIVSVFGELEDNFALQYARAFLDKVDWYELAEAHADAHPELIAPDADDDEAP